MGEMSRAAREAHAGVGQVENGVAAGRLGQFV